MVIIPGSSTNSAARPYSAYTEAASTPRESENDPVATSCRAMNNTTAASQHSVGRSATRRVMAWMLGRWVTLTSAIPMPRANQRNVPGSVDTVEA